MRRRDWVLALAVLLAIVLLTVGAIAWLGPDQRDSRPVTPSTQTPAGIGPTG